MNVFQYSPDILTHFPNVVWRCHFRTGHSQWPNAGIFASAISGGTTSNITTYWQYAFEPNSFAGSVEGCVSRLWR